jgi:hypothetical protein
MNQAIRALVIALFLPGATASLSSSNSSRASFQADNPFPGSLPAPTCPPSDPRHCGMGK